MPQFEPRHTNQTATLMDVLIVTAIARLAPAPGDRVSLVHLRQEFGALSDDAVMIALLDAEARGTITLESSGEDPPDDASWWVLGGARGALCWARVRLDA